MKSTMPCHAMPCPSCGHSNEAKTATCTVCMCTLINKVGRLMTKLCPSCGHLNEAKGISGSKCALISKGGRPELKSTTPCPSCNKANCIDHITSCQEVNHAKRFVCGNCSQPLKQRVLRGRPVERREICQNFLQPNIAKRI